MGTEDNGAMRFQHRDGDDMLTCPSSVMNISPLSEKVAEIAMGSDSMFKASNGVVPYFSSGWDPLVSLSQSENFGAQNGFSNAAYPVGMENQAISSTSHLVHYQPDSGLCEMMPKVFCFRSGCFSEMVNSFGLPECGRMNYSQNKEGDTGNALMTNTHSEECRNSEDKSSPNGKKKRRPSGSHSPFNPNKNAEVPQQHDPSGDNLEQDEKKQKIEQNITANLQGKQTSKQTRENSDSGDVSKDNYIHVRAKRGQATNSHSLAERVRRERISERMRLLQELVPGCNKITGKAVMLDEIINYVQSLQQQVEFLSMKLATVNPELNVDIERILSKDVLSLRGSNAAILGFPGLSPTHPFPQGSLPGIPSITQPFHTMPQSIWDNNELHNLLQMGFDSNINLGPIGNSKLEL